MKSRFLFHTVTRLIIHRLHYYPSESPAKIGKMHYNKKERMFYDIEQAPVDSLNMREHYFNCACTRIVRCLRKNEEFPDSMTYEA
ncbi:hypothetical protein NPX88_25025 [Bacillus mycoides]|uniref:hypothetical protein n=1 Tax=Bacillus TaxID=1386 RepID=UPI0009AE978F|nr:hypothetical protein [Bacillus mycoides]MCQ6568949.1 hypothetical protein [Bacillus mycoides]